jgi:hypothetical protein
MAMHKMSINIFSKRETYKKCLNPIVDALDKNLKKRAVVYQSNEKQCSFLDDLYISKKNGLLITASTQRQ